MFLRLRKLSEGVFFCFQFLKKVQGIFFCNFGLAPCFVEFIRVEFIRLRGNTFFTGFSQARGQQPTQPKVRKTHG